MLDVMTWKKAEIMIEVTYYSSVSRTYPVVPAEGDGGEAARVCVLVDPGGLLLVDVQLEEPAVLAHAHDAAVSRGHRPARLDVS